jgi:predicted dehydrogenase
VNEEMKLSRRAMLSAAAVGALAAGAGSLRAATDAQPGGAPTGSKSKSDATLRWGVIGTGTRGGWTHIPVLKEAPESQTVALCDVSPERMQAAAKRVGHPVATYSDYQKLLANPDINAVVIAVPNLFHREILQAAIQAGKHVLCEKPAGATPADAVAMKQRVDSAKTVIMFGMQYRNNARQQKMAEVIESGRIGKPKYMVQNCSRGDWNLSPNVWRYSDPKVLDGKPVNWRFSHTASGGTLNEFSCHYLDLLHWYAGGLPERVSAGGGISVYHDGRDTWDHASVTLQYADGLTAVHTLCLFGPGRADLTIVGTEGAIETAPKNTLRLTLFAKPGTKRGQRIQEIQPDEPKGHSADRSTLALYQDFLACVKTGKRPDANVDRAVAASRTCWLAELASERKAQVKWDEV